MSSLRHKASRTSHLRLLEQATHRERHSVARENHVEKIQEKSRYGIEALCLCKRRPLHFIENSHNTDAAF